ncbi:MAG: C4-type zinc ribbon domain-containing protein [Candidatus Omnitrophica bacterium]|nr:C4-type zinc ribbon domain-containing protein [Candidatus Omnitrophota bacterium]MDD5077672.1 C4-type zinc ribbon domain-containing protein [Candidatus Omnitrophota bacterium]MDD5725142.1 C4-type zinc ribbon domain-containing protein [Candidatus Omnitrophota bacterium]
MTVSDLKNQISNLIKIQEFDYQIYSLSAKKADKPQEIKRLSDAFELKKQNLVLLEKQSLEIQKQRKEKELELAANAEGIKKLSGQLFSLKTNKEFQTMQQQIADAKADGSVIEERILVSFEEADKIKAQIDSENIKLKEEEKIYLQQKKDVESSVKEIDDQLVQLETQRKQIIPEIDPKIFQEYERILSSREGLAIVPVEHNSCGGCHMLVPPQVINLIKMYSHIITCEVCNRILYIRE